MLDELGAVACLPVDWDQLVAAAGAALVAAGGTLAAKHRPSGARTRVDDGKAADEGDLPWLDDLEVWADQGPAEPLAGWPPRRARSRLGRAADELRGRTDSGQPD